MITSFLLKCAPGSVTPIPDSNAYQYPGAQDLARDMTYNDGSDWEVWLCNIRGSATDQQDNPTFTAQPGDTILAGWDAESGEVREAYPIHQDIYDYVQPIGNQLNATTGAYDGSVSFPVHHHFMGHATRFWGTVNPYPDNNQSRHCIATRFTTDWPSPGNTLHRIKWVLAEPFDVNNAPNALAVAVYADAARTTYLYTMGGFIWDTEAEEWYSEMPLGQSPSTPQDCHYAILLGSAPLGGGLTMTAEMETQEGYHWDVDLV